MIAILVIAFNFSAPESNLIELKLRHLIEYAQTNHTRSLKKDEALKARIILYAEYLIIASMVDREKRVLKSAPT